MGGAGGAGTRHRSRHVVTAVLVLFLAATACLVVGVVRGRDRTDAPTAAGASLSVDHPGARGHHHHHGHRHGRHHEGWPGNPTATVPLGAHPGRGLPAPTVLTPAEELDHLGRLPTGWAAKVETVHAGGLTRSYVVAAPIIVTSRARSLPLYVALHGRGANPDLMARMTDLAAQTGPAVVVLPAGYEDSWNAGGCCGYAHADRVDDVAFVHTVVERVLADYPAASPHRVYAIGFSNGGRMTYRLACDLPGTFAGIAAVEAVPVIDCHHLDPLDVEIIAQKADPLLSISDRTARKTMDGYLEPTVESAVDQWRTLDGCRPHAAVTSDGVAVERTWNCAAGTQLQYTLYPGGGHRWPKGSARRPGGTGIILDLLAPDRHGLA